METYVNTCELKIQNDSSNEKINSAEPASNFLYVDRKW